MGILELPPVLAVRRSFRWKLLLTLVASVTLLATITLLVMRRETQRQIESAVRLAEERAAQAFLELERQNGDQLSQLSGVFSESRQAVALLEAALESRDTERLREEVAYELERRRISLNPLVAFTDANAEPVLAMVEGQALSGDDPAGVRAPAERVLFDGEDDVRGYRVIARQLYSVETVFLELGRPVGTVTLGIPLSDAQVTVLSSVIGADVCFVLGGRCVAGTVRGRGDVEAAMVERSGAPASDFAEIGGERWRIVSDRFSDDEDTAWWVIALPLAPVVGPFQRVQRALLASALGALLLAGALAGALARSLTRPVRALVDATSRVGSGDYGARVEVSSIDEMGTLAAAFNQMTEGLALKEKYRGVLDKVVSKDIADELLKGEVKLGGENREVSVLFADITGFTRITDGMEPPEVIRMLNECMEHLTDVVEREGGVVDKYVGDQIMALFGAPVARGQDALRAVRAALGMQKAMDMLNAVRAGRGEPPLEVSVGVNTGVAMAGNMGSPTRLNYTVLGDAVNLASRVESKAPSGQILISEHTLAHVAEHVRVEDLGPVELRGFAQPVRLYRLLDVTGAPEPRTARSGVGSALVGVALAAALALSAQGAGAQRLGELPTLERAYFSSASGAFQVGLSGRLDLEGYLPQDDPAWIIPSTSPFGAPRLRLFTDVFLGDRLMSTVELRVDGSEEPIAGELEARIDQAFVRFVPDERIAFQVGRFASPFAGYAQRHHTVADPLIRPPLMYDHRTVMSATNTPGSGVGLWQWKDNPEQHRPTGSPIVWGVPYQWGGMVTGLIGRVSARAALMNSAPSSGPGEWGLGHGFDGPSFVLGAGVQLVPALHIEVSHDRGPWRRQDYGVGGTPVGRWDDYDQIIWGAEAVFTYGGSKLRGEVFHDRWEVPNIDDDVVDVSWYLEGEHDVWSGFTLAARYGAIHFSDVQGGFQTHNFGEPWDYDVSRLQLGAGYRLARNAGVRVEGMLNRSAAPYPVRNNLAALQLWWEF